MSYFCNITLTRVIFNIKTLIFFLFKSTMLNEVILLINFLKTIFLLLVWLEHSEEQSK